jgi:agmatinase
MNVLTEEHNFLGLEASLSNFQKSKYVIQQAPFEATSSYLEGSKFGPKAIIEASKFVEFYDPELDTQACEDGICTLAAMDFKGMEGEQAVNLIRQNTEELLAKSKHVITIGGEHTITFGCAQAYHKKHPNMSLLQLDAHSDLRDTYEGSKYSHASVMARVHDLNIPISQVGIRAQCIEEAELIKKSSIIHTWYNHQIQLNDNWQEDVVKSLNDEVYITIDADGFDPSLVPAVGTSEPGGLQWFETLKLLKMVAQNKTIIGFDVVECAPQKNSVRSEYVLAQLIYKLISYISLVSKS